MEKIRVITLLILLSGVMAAQAQWKGIAKAVKNVPKSVIVAKASESALRQHQNLQQQNRLTALHVQTLNDIQRVQRLDQQATLRTQLLQSLHTIQPVCTAKNNAAFKQEIIKIRNAPRKEQVR